MHSAFAAALDRLFVRLGVPATYEGKHHHSLAINVILKVPDQIVDFGEAQLHTTTQVMDVKCSDIKKPCIGDVITIYKTRYRIQSEPLRDQHGLLWKCDVVKTCD